MIAQQNILSGKRSPFKRDMDVFRQPNDGRSVDRQLFRVEHVAIMLFDARHTLKDHHYGAPFRAHVDGLKGSV